MESAFVYIKVFVDIDGEVYLLYRRRDHHVIHGFPLAVIGKRPTDGELQHIGRRHAGAIEGDPVIVQVIRE